MYAGSSNDTDLCTQFSNLAMLTNYITQFALYISTYTLSHTLSCSMYEDDYNMPLLELNTIITQILQINIIVGKEYNPSYMLVFRYNVHPVLCPNKLLHAQTVERR